MAKSDGVGDVRGAAAGPVICPLSVHVDLPVDQRLPASGGPGCHHPDLAQEDTASMPEYCPATPTGARPFLAKPVSSTTSTSAPPGPAPLVQALDDVTTG